MMPRYAAARVLVMLGALLPGIAMQVGCDGPPDDHDGGDVVDLTLVDQVIGPEGGYVEWRGVARLTIPRDVLEVDREFTIAVNEEPGVAIGAGVAASAVVTLSSDQERFVSPVSFEIQYDTATLPDSVDPDAMVLLTLDDDQWVPAKGWEVDADRGLIRGFSRVLGRWTVAAPPRDATRYSIEANVAPTFFPGDPGSAVSEDLIVSAIVSAPAGIGLVADDVRVRAELYGTSRDSADAVASVSWGLSGPTVDALIPDQPRQAALQDLVEIWDAQVAPSGLTFVGSGGEGGARVGLVIDREVLTALRDSPAAVYRIDLCVSVGRWPAESRSAVTRVYLYSPRYLPLVAVDDAPTCTSDPVPSELVWRYPDVYYEVIEGLELPADPGGLTLLISDTADPYTQPRWRLSNSGALRPHASGANLTHDGFFRAAADPSAGEVIWACTLPETVTSQLTPGEYTWAVITDSSVEWEQDTAVDPLFWPLIPDGRSLSWLLLDPTPVSDADGNAVHDFQSPIFALTVDVATDGPPVDCCGEDPCDVDTSGAPACTTIADCATGEICSNGSCVIDVGAGGGTTTPSDFLVLALGGGQSIILRRISPGTVTMGSAAGYPDELPTHAVTIGNEFFIGQFEVTQDQWFAVMGTSPSIFTASGQQPVEWVSWDDATLFCDTLSAATGRTVRLPTEAEWEYTCRAGTDTVYHFGDDANDLGDYGWFIGNSGSVTHPVAEKLPNAWGLYDMHGNVWEWCQDWYGDTYYASSPATDPTGPASGDARVVRGGSWERGNDISSSTRGRSDPDVRHNGLGFRVVVE